MKEITNESRAYFAGLLDGEGCISIIKSVKKDYIGYTFRVEFALTYKKILLDMQKLFGGNIYEDNMKKRKTCDSAQTQILHANASPDNWKQSYSYILNGRDALYFLKIVEPFCQEKKEQAALGIRYEQGRRSHAGRFGRSESETERCGFFYRELQRMKHEQLNENENEIDFEDDQQKLSLFVEEN